MIKNKLKWNIVSKKAYWDCLVPLSDWRIGISNMHNSYLPDAIQYLTPQEFIYFYGIEKFKSHYPKLKHALPDKLKNKTHYYDVIWSQLVGGGLNLKPFLGFNKLPKIRRKFLLYIMSHPGLSTYEISKKLNLQYRRAYDHMQFFVQSGILRQLETFDGKRQKFKLYPSYNYKI